MPSFTASKAFNDNYISQFKGQDRPVVVVLGGTQGIGASIATSFAQHTNGRAHIIIVGRSQTNADNTLATFPQSSEATYEFVQCDASSMAASRKVAKELADRLPKINFLCLTAGYSSFGARDDTGEGLDRRLAIRYYSRWIFIWTLVHLVQRAQEKGEATGVLSVNGSPATAWPTLDKDGKVQHQTLYTRMVLKINGDMPEILKDDLAYKKNPTGFKTMMASGIYADLSMDSFADLHPALSFVHCYPGFVATNGMQTVKDLPPWYLKPLGWFAAQVLTNFFAISSSESAEYMLYALFDAEPGSFSKNQRGDLTRLAKNKAASSGGEEDKKALWEHTKEITGV
ncbi:hypothetical protein DL96DRAFT_1811656 [Flagelloscypha sp. PMI_526]|nr:hypothetical protein DL96DRAFT_1811656 [Flagelloscypha sp. PMI_526]